LSSEWGKFLSFRKVFNEEIKKIKIGKIYSTCSHFQIKHTDCWMGEKTVSKFRDIIIKEVGGKRGEEKSFIIKDFYPKMRLAV
jgi:hypothetical protein